MVGTGGVESGRGASGGGAVGINGCGGRHRCELPGNYPVFTVVMVIYTFVRRISIITLPSDFF